MFAIREVEHGLELEPGAPPASPAPPKLARLRASLDALVAQVHDLPSLALRHPESV